MLKVYPTFLHMTSSENQTPDLLILSQMPSHSATCRRVFSRCCTHTVKCIHGFIRLNQAHEDVQQEPQMTNHFVLPPLLPPLVVGKLQQVLVL